MRILSICLLGLSLVSVAVADTYTHRIGKRAMNRREQREAATIKKQIDDVTDNVQETSRSDGKGSHIQKKEESEADDNGNKVIKLEQRYKGIKVLGAEVTRHHTKGGMKEEIDKGTGKVVKKRHVEPKKTDTGKMILGLDKEVKHIDTDKLKKGAKGVLDKVVDVVKARRKRDAPPMEVEDAEATPVIHPGEKGKKAKAGYVITFKTDMTQGNPARPVVHTDENGKIELEYDAIATNKRDRLGTGPGGNSKVGKYHYGKDYDKMTVTVMSNGKCKLESDTIKTIHLQNSQDRSKSQAFEYDCYNQDSDSKNGAHSPLNDAHYFGEKVYSLYTDWYGEQPLKHTPLVMKVHYKNNFENAFWDGRAMTFGDGASYFHPLVSLDVMAHEVSHGVTEQKSGLVYEGQSGGLNEAFSDMAGKAAERYVRGKVNWAIGSDIVKGKGGLRCMDNPECDKSSIGHVNKFYKGMDVHHSSGVFNKVFYLCAKKFKYDVWDAFDLFYTANTKGYWNSRISFKEAAEETLKALDDLKAGRHFNFNYDHLNSNDVVDAFKQVGITCSKSGSWSCQSPK